jgi:hypothetical protein
MHGGAKGSGAPRGNKNALKHGVYTREALERRAQLRGLLREAREVLKESYVSPIRVSLSGALYLNAALMFRGRDFRRARDLLLLLPKLSQTLTGSRLQSTIMVSVAAIPLLRDALEAPGAEAHYWRLMTAVNVAV